ncbi:MAG: thiol:disulfide interchange protein DsbG [Salinisphaera sp.]|nr:thiol:disulfide interchange protein DsbG [Salinisphaera sp.]
MIVATTSAAAATPESKPSWPPAIQQMADKGLTIVKAFDAPGGVQGYAAKAGHTPVALYLTPDGKHVIVGTMLDDQGHNLTGPALDAAIVAPQQQNAWPQLAASNWIADGNDNAPRTIYVFTDPNCPYCHKFYEDSRPWVRSGKVQLRQIVVGVLRPSSPGKAAALLAAKDPSAAYRRHEKHYRTGGIKPLDPVPEAMQNQVVANNTLMSALSIRGTPGIVYKDADGHIQIQQGVPQGHTLREIMGPR